MALGNTTGLDDIPEFGEGVTVGAPPTTITSFDDIPEFGEDVEVKIPEAAPIEVPKVETIKGRPVVKKEAFDPSQFTEKPAEVNSDLDLQYKKKKPVIDPYDAVAEEKYKTEGAAYYDRLKGEVVALEGKVNQVTDDYSNIDWEKYSSQMEVDKEVGARREQDEFALEAKKKEFAKAKRLHDGVLSKESIVEAENKAENMPRGEDDALDARTGQPAIVQQRVDPQEVELNFMSKTNPTQALVLRDKIAQGKATELDLSKLEAQGLSRMINVNANELQIEAEQKKPLIEEAELIDANLKKYQELIHPLDEQQKADYDANLAIYKKGLADTEPLRKEIGAFEQIAKANDGLTEQQLADYQELFSKYEEATASLKPAIEKLQFYDKAQGGLTPEQQADFDAQRARLEEIAPQLSPLSDKYKKIQDLQGELATGSMSKKALAIADAQTKRAQAVDDWYKEQNWFDQARYNSRNVVEGTLARFASSIISLPRTIAAHANNIPLMGGIGYKYDATDALADFATSMTEYMDGFAPSNLGQEFAQDYAMINGLKVVVKNGEVESVRDADGFLVRDPFAIAKATQDYEEKKPTLKTEHNAGAGAYHAANAIMDMGVTLLPIGGLVGKWAKGLGAADKVADAVGIYAGSFILIHKTAYEDGLAAGLSPELASFYAHGMAAIETATETLNPLEMKLIRKLRGGSSASRLGAEEFARRYVAGASKTSALVYGLGQVAKNMGMEGLEEMGARYLGDKLDESLNVLAASDFDVKSTTNEYLGDFVIGAATGLAFSPIVIAGSRSDLERQTLSMLVESPDDAIKYIDALVGKTVLNNKGEKLVFTQEQADAVKLDMKNLTERVNSIKDISNLDDEKKVSVTALVQSKMALERELAKPNLDDIAKKKYKALIEGANKQLELLAAWKAGDSYITVNNEVISDADFKTKMTPEFVKQAAFGSVSVVIGDNPVLQEEFRKQFDEARKGFAYVAGENDSVDKLHSYYTEQLKAEKDPYIRKHLQRQLKQIGDSPIAFYENRLATLEPNKVVLSNLYKDIIADLRAKKGIPLTAAQAAAQATTKAEADKRAAELETYAKERQVITDIYEEDWEGYTDEQQDKFRAERERIFKEDKKLFDTHASSEQKAELKKLTKKGFLELFYTKDKKRRADWDRYATETAYISDVVDEILGVSKAEATIATAITATTTAATNSNAPITPNDVKVSITGSNGGFGLKAGDQIEEKDIRHVFDDSAIQESIASGTPLQVTESKAGGKRVIRVIHGTVDHVGRTGVSIINVELPENSSLTKEQVAEIASEKIKEKTDNNKQHEFYGSAAEVRNVYDQIIAEIKQKGTETTKTENNVSQQGTKGVGANPAGNKTVGKKDGGEVVEGDGEKASAEKSEEEKIDEARVARRMKNEDILTAEGSTFYADIDLKKAKIGDEIHYESYKDGEWTKHKTKVKDIVDGKVIFENGQTSDDVSSYMNITAEDAWFAKNLPEAESLPTLKPKTNEKTDETASKTDTTNQTGSATKTGEPSQTQTRAVNDASETKDADTRKAKEEEIADDVNALFGVDVKFNPDGTYEITGEGDIEGARTFVDEATKEVKKVEPKGTLEEQHEAIVKRQGEIFEKAKTDAEARAEYNSLNKKKQAIERQLFQEKKKNRFKEGSAKYFEFERVMEEFHNNSRPLLRKVFDFIEQFGELTFEGNRWLDLINTAFGNVEALKPILNVVRQLAAQLTYTNEGSSAMVDRMVQSEYWKKALKGVYRSKDINAAKMKKRLGSAVLNGIKGYAGYTEALHEDYKKYKEYEKKGYLKGIPKSDEAPVKEQPKEPLSEARQFGVDFANAGLVETREIGGRGNEHQRLDLRMSNDEKIRAIKDIKEGNYDTTAAKMMLDRIEQMYNEGALGYVMGSGGSTQQAGAVPIEDAKKHIEEIKQGKPTEEAPKPTEDEPFHSATAESIPEEIHTAIVDRIKNALSQAFGTAVHIVKDAKELMKAANKEPLFHTKDGNPIGFQYDTDQVARERFDLSKLKQIGKGSDRTVFDLGNGKVLKIAHTARGLAQNIYEGDGYLAGDVIPEVHERGLNYVVTDNAPRLKAADIVPVYDWNSGEEIGTERAGAMMKELSKFDQNDFDEHNADLEAVLAKYGLTNIFSYNVMYNDFAAMRNWGYKDGVPLHIDGGTFGGVERILNAYSGKTSMQDADYRAIYYKSRAVKKGNKETDKFTKFQDQKGEPLGFADRNGDIWLNGEKINGNTPVHEAGHLWQRWAAEHAPNLLKAGLDKISRSPYLAQVRNNKFYIDQADKKGLKGKEREDFFRNEALAMAIGDKGEQFVTEAKKADFQAWLSELWKAVAEFAGLSEKTAAQIENMTMDEFAKAVAADLLSGKTLKGKVEGKGNSEFQIIGERAVSKVENHEKPHLRQIADNLGAAKEMEKSGMSPKEIWLATGWERSKDKGKWKYDLPDVEFNKNVGKIPTKTIDVSGRGYTFKEVKLSEIIADDKGLFELYPQAKDINVVLYDFNHPDHVRGTYREGSTMFPEDTITLWGVDYSGNLTEEQQSTLLHEMQHFVQAKEGFASGGNENTVSEKDIPVNPKWAEYNTPENKKRAAEYIALRDSEEYARELAESNALFKDYGDRIDELHKQITRENHKEITDKVDAIFEEFNEVAKEKFPVMTKADAIAKETVVREPSKTISKFEAYRRLAGEVESRNVQGRADLTLDERKEKLISETEDVAEGSKIYLYAADSVGGVGSYASAAASPMSLAIDAAIEAVALTTELTGALAELLDMALIELRNSDAYKSRKSQLARDTAEAQLKAKLKERISSAKATAREEEPKEKKHKLGVRVTNSSTIDEEIKQGLLNEGISYLEKTREMSDNDAREIIAAYDAQGDLDGAMNYITSDANIENLDVRVALEQALYKRYAENAVIAAEEGDTDAVQYNRKKAIDILAIAQKTGEAAGRAVNKQKDWAELTEADPDALVFAAQSEYAERNKGRLAPHEDTIKTAQEKLKELLESEEGNALFRAKVEEKVAAEQNRPVRKSNIERAMDALDKAHIKLRSMNFVDVSGVTVAMVDGAFAAAKVTLRTTKSVLEAVETAVKYVKEELAKAGITDWEKEGAFRQAVEESLTADGIRVPKKKIPKTPKQQKVQQTKDVAQGLKDQIATLDALIKDPIKALEALEAKKKKAEERVAKNEAKSEEVKDLENEIAIRKKLLSLVQGMDNLTDHQKKEILSESLNSIIQNGYLSEPSFRGIFAKALGLDALTAKDELVLKKGAAVIQNVLVAQRAYLANPTSQNLRAYRRAVREGKRANAEVSWFFRERATTGDILSSVIRGNLLSTTTIALSGVSNTLTYPIWLAVDAGASALDFLRFQLSKIDFLSKNVPYFTNRRYNDFLANKLGAWSAIPQGVREGLSQVITGHLPDSIYHREMRGALHPIQAWGRIINSMSGKEKQKLMHSINDFIEGTAGVAPEIIFRALGVTDTPVRYSAEQGVLREVLATNLAAERAELEKKPTLTTEERQLLDDIKSGVELKKRMVMPDEASEKMSAEEGARRVFQNQNILAQMLDAAMNKYRELMKEKFGEEVDTDRLFMKNLKSLKKIIAVLEFPFINMPLNWAQQAIYLTNPTIPLAVGMAYAAKGDVRNANKSFSLAFVGYMLGIAAKFLVESGVLQGSAGDDDDDERTKAYAVKGGYKRMNWSLLNRTKFDWSKKDTQWKEGDVTFEFYQLGLGGAVLLSYADLYKKNKEEMDAQQDYFSGMVSYLKNKGASSVRTGLDMPMVQGTSQILNALASGDAWATDKVLIQTLNALKAVVVPSTVIKVRRAMNAEEFLKNTEDKDWFKKFKNGFKDQLGDRDELPNRHTIWGEPVLRTPSDVNAIVYNLFDLSKSKENPSSFGIELYNMHERLIKENPDMVCAASEIK